MASESPPSNALYELERLRGDAQELQLMVALARRNRRQTWSLLSAPHSRRLAGLVFWFE